MSAQQADPNRRRMLEIVRETWIDDYLEHSLENLARIDLGLEKKPDAVSRPFDLMVQPPDRAPRRLLPGQAMGDIFEELGQALLILGAPGAGKTTLLLELTRDLLDRAEQDVSYPMPVVFHLSSWAVRRRPLADWLIDELAKRYYVARKLAQAWVDAEQVLPLLDGLDEVAPEHRTACVEAINTFRCQHGLVPLAVCCRAADYQALPARVELSGAVAIEPLSRTQVSTYLKQAGKPLAGLRTALRDDETLWELLDTPLMLSIVTLAYRGRSATEVRATGSLEERRAHLFANYTERMFERRTKVTEYTREQTIHWLAWLARILVGNNLSMFYVEWMQPDWLLARKQKWVIILVTIALEAFVGLVLGLGSGLIAGLVVLLAFDLHLEIRFILLSTGLQGGLGGVLIGMLIDYIYGHRITPAESLRWSWTAARNKLDYTLTIGMGVAFGLLFGVIHATFAGLGEGLIHGPVVGSVIGLAFWLVRGTVTDLIPTRTKPNEGIRRSLKSALISFLAVGLVGGLIYGLIQGLIYGQSGLIYGPVAGLKFVLIFWSGSIMMFGMIGGLTNGGHAYIKHYVLRLLLWRNNFSPRNHIRFLDYAAERVFLRKVGGGYIFTHRLLMEYFATLEPIEQTKRAKAE